jgi:acyl CoA:acetate/3-ketoacid CoA transferase
MLAARDARRREFQGFTVIVQVERVCAHGMLNPRQCKYPGSAGSIALSWRRPKKENHPL